MHKVSSHLNVWVPKKDSSSKDITGTLEDSVVFVGDGPIFHSCIPNVIPKNKECKKSRKKVKYILTSDELNGEALFARMPTITKQIEEFIENRATVYVLCEEHSNASTMLIAYWMWKESTTRKEAIRYITNIVNESLPTLCNLTLERWELYLNPLP